MKLVNPHQSVGKRLENEIEAFLLQSGVDNSDAGMLMTDPKLAEKLISIRDQFQIRTISNRPARGYFPCFSVAASEWLESGDVSVVLLLEGYSGQSSALLRFWSAQWNMHPKLKNGFWLLSAGAAA